MTMMRRTASQPAAGMVVLEVFEDGVPPRFRLHAETGPALDGLTRPRSKRCGRTGRASDSP